MGEFNENSPSVVVVSSSSTKPTSIIKLITGKSEFVVQEPNFMIQPLRLDTKYYTATIKLVGVEETSHLPPQLKKTIEALIIHFDSNKVNGLDNIKRWHSIEEDTLPEVKLLIANYCNESTKVTRLQATEWCLKRGYELIELFPAKGPPEDDCDDIIKEKVGVERIIEALGAHTWCEMEMKDHRKDSTSAEASVDLSVNDGLDEFADLFSQLNTMKESLKDLSVNQRKQCAEQMVTAFWRAIGGDEDEIADI